MVCSIGDGEWTTVDNGRGTYLELLRVISWQAAAIQPCPYGPNGPSPQILFSFMLFLAKLTPLLAWVVLLRYGPYVETED
jgi:hypothetical protein